MNVLEKIFEELEERGNIQFSSYSKPLIAVEDVLKIIRSHMDDEDNDGWIPVEERLPEEHDSIFAKFKGTSKWGGVMWEKQSDEVNVTYELEDGTRKATTSYTLDGVWKLEKESKVVKKKVVAWQPLPEPYRSKEKDNE